MVDLYARIVLRLIGPALALRERGLAERLEGLHEAAQGPCVNAVADELLKSAGFGEPTLPKNGGDAEAEGAAQPHKPTPSSPCGGVAALYEAMQQAAVSAPVVLLERSLRVRLTPATLSELDESGPPRTVSSRPVNLADRATAVAPAFGQDASLSTSELPAGLDAPPTSPAPQAPQQQGESL